MTKTWTALVVLTSLALVASANALASDNQLPITLNQKPFGTGIVFQDGLFVRVSDVARSINGTAELAPRLQVKDGSLVGVTAGGCGACRIRVSQTGKAIGAVKSVNGSQYIHIESLSHALAASLTKTSDAANLKASACTNCTLSVVAEK